MSGAQAPACVGDHRAEPRVQLVRFVDVFAAQTGREQIDGVADDVRRRVVRTEVAGQRERLRRRRRVVSRPRARIDCPRRHPSRCLRRRLPGAAAPGTSGGTRSRAPAAPRRAAGAPRGARDAAHSGGSGAPGRAARGRSRACGAGASRRITGARAPTRRRAAGGGTAAAGCVAAPRRGPGPTVRHRSTAARGCRPAASARGRS